MLHNDKSSFQTFLYTLLESPDTNRASYWVNYVIYILIITSVISLMLSTVESLNAQYKSAFLMIENIIMPIFILEYLARVYAIGKLRYIFSPFALLDLLAIMPYILSGLNYNTAFIRSLRLIRIFRLFRMKKYEIFSNVMQHIFMRKKEEFTVLLFYTVIMIVILSFVIYGVEHEAQPEVFTNVVQTLWWAVATLTTVGYGDMYPVTSVGQFITAVITVMGIAFIAIPGGIFASEFMNAFERKKDQTHDASCPKCDSEEIDVKELKGNLLDEDRDFKKLHRCKSCDLCWLTF